MLENGSHICGHGISPHTSPPPVLAYFILLLPTTVHYPDPFNLHFTSLWAIYMEVHESEPVCVCSNLFVYIEEVAVNIYCRANRLESVVCNIFLSDVNMFLSCPG